MLIAPAETVAREFEVDVPTSLEPREDIRPGQSVLAVRAAQPRQRPPASSNAAPQGATRLETHAGPFGDDRTRLRDHAGPPHAEREAVMFRWGLVPHWAKDPRIGNRLINARIETAAQKPSFRDAFRRRRCLIPADGFYEWQSRGKHKQKFLIRGASGRLLALAGLWERWRDANGVPVETCTILTTEPNDLLRPIHDRMPVIVPRDHYRDWLGLGTVNENRLKEILQPNTPEALEALAVDALV